MSAFNSISPAALFRLIGTPDAPAVIDVRTDADFEAHAGLIPTARRWPHREVASCADALRGRQVVVVCHGGLKLSHGAAAVLRGHGLLAIVLEGGTEAWRAAALPLVPTAAIGPGWTGGPTRWVTRHRPKIDRIACPWLIRRFVDPAAEVLFVPPAEVDGVAERFEATPFDTPDAPWTHVGDRCTFDAMVEGFGLACPALDTMADVIRAADTGRCDTVAEAAGLLALSVGLSRACKDDLAQLDAGMILYDALFRWARDGAGETHGWPGKHHP
ncbi:chromate resistance protein [Seohaeicola saemankumensis]|nr:chromate resistance protein ChrB domain-containing protein [Seohaeicola saemankumensis]MCA0872162.1 chromate resistance protein [Seohaeicola saemankumensis]